MAKTYRKLPGTRRELWSHHTLWLGQDHLLAVRLTGFTESYRRFYFHDILATSIHSQPGIRATGFEVAVVLVLPLVACLLFVARQPFFGAVPLLAAIALTIFLALRKGSVVILHTALGPERLLCCHVERSARRALAIAHGAIEAAQANIAVVAQTDAVEEPARFIEQTVPPTPPQLEPVATYQQPPSLPKQQAASAPATVFVAYLVTIAAATLWAAVPLTGSGNWIPPASFVASALLLSYSLSRGKEWRKQTGRSLPALILLVCQALIGMWSLTLFYGLISSPSNNAAFQFYAKAVNFRPMQIAAGTILAGLALWGSIGELIGLAWNKRQSAKTLNLTSSGSP